MKKPNASPAWTDKAVISSQMGELESKYEAASMKVQIEMTAAKDKMIELTKAEKDSRSNNKEEYEHKEKLITQEFAQAKSQQQERLEKGVAKLEEIRKEFKEKEAETKKAL